MGGIKRAIMDEIGESFSMWRSGITGDKSSSLSVIFRIRLMTNIWSASKVFLLLNVGFDMVCLTVCERERENINKFRRR